VKVFFPASGYNSLLEKEIKKRECEAHGVDKNDASCEQSKESATSDGKSSDHAGIAPSKKSQETSNGTIQQVKQGGFDFSDVNPYLVEKIKAHVANMGQSVIEREQEEMEKVLKSEIKELPYISFYNGKRRLIRPQPFSKEFKGVGTAVRWQIPLTLAWAISIHKSQGMTIECLFVNLAHCFAIGQAYVACSRGKCLNSMTVKRFKSTEIKTSEKVRNFYCAVSKGKPYLGGTWSDTIAEFDKAAKKEMKKMKQMKKRYNSAVSCGVCGTMCAVRQIKTNRNNNQGKYFISCTAANGEPGHTWELVNTLHLHQSNRSEPYKLLIPGVGGAIKGRLEDKQFVLTGVFPNLGGGSGLKLGKDKMKAMIESFGGKVTGSISGKTNFVVFGLEPGAKRLEDAEARGVPTMDPTSLQKIFLGEAELLAPDEEDPQPAEAKCQHFHGDRYECC